jgi:HK97 family phage prohead protease
MPWHVAKSSACPESKPWAVIKNSDDSVAGCHETEEAAKKQLAALYASESPKGADVKHKTFDLIETKAEGEDGWFSALASVFGNVDHVGDRVMPGAFKKTLKKWRESGRPLPVILSHQWENPFATIGKADPRAVMETDQGLLVQGQLDIAGNDTAKQVHKLMKEGLMTGWSFGYTVPDDGERLGEDGANEITEIDLVEIGPTLKGANPEAQLQAVKSALDVEAPAETGVVDELHAWQAGQPITSGTSGNATVTITGSPGQFKWDGSASRYTDEQYAAACALDRGDCGSAEDMPAKQRYSLPYKNPGSSSPDPGGVHAAAQRLSSVNACSDAKKKAAGKLLRAYSAIGDDPPDSLREMAGKALPAEASPEDGTPEVVAEVPVSDEALEKAIAESDQFQALVAEEVERRLAEREKAEPPPPEPKPDPLQDLLEQPVKTVESEKPESPPVKPAAKADLLKDEIDRLRLEIAVGKPLRRN